MCVSFDQIIGDKGREQVNRKENKGKERGGSANFQYFIGTCMQKGDAIFCGVRSDMGSKQLWSRL
jgi:hypothetical protein